LVHEGSGVVRVDYDASGAADDVSGFGFTISLSEGIISDISNFHEGESKTGNKGYGIYPGSVSIDTSGEDPVVNSWGTPIDLTQDPDNSGLNEDNMYIAMGALYEEPNKPDDSGTLFKFTIDDSSCTADITITVTGDSVSAGDAGGVVLVDGSSAAIDPQGYLVHLCDTGCFSGTPEEEDAWDYWANLNGGVGPTTWCSWCWRCGDVNDDQIVEYGDYLQVYNDVKNGDTTGRSDINMDEILEYGDILEVFNYVKDALGCTPCE
jgi:hypothetical protein